MFNSVLAASQKTWTRKVASFKARSAEPHRLYSWFLVNVFPSPILSQLILYHHRIFQLS